MQQEQRSKFQTQTHLTPGGTFEVLAITAGEGNGWAFPEDVLRASLPLWDGAECFVDHAGGPGRSVRDLGGAFFAPAWDEAARGVRLSLRTMGPSGPLVEALGRELLRGGANPRPDIGFSADIGFLADGKEVVKILRVYSLDLVCHPARGGAFVREVEEQLSRLSQHRSNSTHSDASKGAALMKEEAAFQETVLPENQAQATGLHASLLDAELAASRLPRPLEADIRARFSGRAYDPAELKRAVQDGRALVAALTAGQSVQGPSITEMHDSSDQLQAAVCDLFDLPRDKGLETVRAARLSGIRELYLYTTGDYDLHGGYYPERTRLATTADFTGLVKNALNKIVANRWTELGRAGYDWWSRVATVEHFNTMQQITGTLIGTVGSLPEVAEGGAYTELAVGDSPETASFTKYGGYIPLTLELIDRDETRKLKAYPRELASAGLHKLSSLVAGVFTANNGVGPTMADNGALFNNIAATTEGGHANLGTTALSADAWEAASRAVYAQPMLIKNADGVYGTGPRMAVDPRYLLVSRPQQLAAMKILYPSLENAANIYSENQQRGRPGDVITVPDWTDATDWAAACDPVVAPAIFIGERFGLMPEIFIAGDELSPAVFTNDEHRLKVRFFVSVWVNDFRPLYKANVAA